MCHPNTELPRGLEQSTGPHWPLRMVTHHCRERRGHLELVSRPRCASWQKEASPIGSLGDVHAHVSVGAGSRRWVCGGPLVLTRNPRLPHPAEDVGAEPRRLGLRVTSHPLSAARFRAGLNSPRRSVRPSRGRCCASGREWTRPPLRPSAAAAPKGPFPLTPTSALAPGRPATPAGLLITNAAAAAASPHPASACRAPLLLQPPPAPAPGGRPTATRLPWLPPPVVSPLHTERERRCDHLPPVPPG